MKIITIGDIHGRKIWKNFVDINYLLNAEPDAAGFGGFEPEYDKYIFSGDYVDSFTKNNTEIRENLLEIIRFKTLYPNNVILLWGNHDTDYYLNKPWLPLKNPVSGFRPEMHYDLFDIFYKYNTLFQFSFQIDNYLWTHAGVHYGWYHYVFTKAIKNEGWNDLTISEQLNNAFEIRLECLFDIDFYRGGSKRIGGPLWVDKKLISKKPLKNTHQIVGHNPVNQISTYNINNGTLTFCDILHIKQEYYVLTI